MFELLYIKLILMKYTYSDQAYKKAFLHSMKHCTADCYGILIGKEVKRDEETKVTDSIPLFHDRIFPGALNIAFDMIESTFL